MLVVGFFSKGTAYEDEARIFTASLDKVGMKYDVRGFTSKGDWYANTAQKAELIRDARAEHKGPMLYIDVDAFVHVNCAAHFDELGAKGYDFGAHYFSGPAKGRRWHRACNTYLDVLSQYGIEARRLLSGTLFFGDTEGARALLDNWVKLNAALRSMELLQGGGQKNLWYLTTCMEGLRIAKLPGRFCYIADKRHCYPKAEPNWIEHTIASRENRETVRVNPERRKKIEALKQKVSL